MGFIQAPVGTTGTGSGALTLAYGSNVTAGNLLIACTHWDRGQTWTSISDTVGTTWNLIGSELDGGATLNERSRFYYGVAPSTGANTVSRTNSGAVFRYLSIAEYSLTATLDTNPAATASSGGTLTSPSFTVAQNSSLVVVFGVCSGTGSADTGYNSRVTANGDIVADITLNAGAGQVATAIQTGTSVYNIHAAVFNTGGTSFVAPVGRRYLQAVNRAANF